MSDGPSGECLAERRQRARRAATDPPACAAVPQDEYADTGFRSLESADCAAVFHKQGASLDKLALSDGFSAGESPPAGDGGLTRAAF